MSKARKRLRKMNIKPRRLPTSASKTAKASRVIEYGAYIPTLVKQIEAGEFSSIPQ